MYEVNSKFGSNKWTALIIECILFSKKWFFILSYSAFSRYKYTILNFSGGNCNYVSFTGKSFQVFAHKIVKKMPVYGRNVYMSRVLFTNFDIENIIVTTAILILLFCRF